MTKLKGQERIEVHNHSYPKKCQYLRNRITRAKQVLRSINVEIRGLEKTKAPEWEDKAKKYEEVIAKLAQDVEWAEQTSTGKGKQEPPAKKSLRAYKIDILDIDEMTTGEITKHALKVQDKTQESTARAQKALQETIEVII
jgi:hypothetical protein